MLPLTLALQDAFDRAPIWMCVIGADSVVKLAGEKMRAHFGISGSGFALSFSTGPRKLGDIFGAAAINRLLQEVADVGAARGVIRVNDGPYKGAYRLRMARISSSGVADVVVCVDDLTDLNDDLDRTIVGLEN